MLYLRHFPASRGHSAVRAAAGGLLNTGKMFGLVGWSALWSCGLSTAHLRWGEDARAAGAAACNCRPNSTEDRGGPETVELGEPGWVSPQPRSLQQCDSFFSSREEDPETCLLACQVWGAERGHLWGQRGRQWTGGRPEQTKTTEAQVPYKSCMRKLFAEQHASVAAWHFLGWRHLVPFDTDNLDTCSSEASCRPVYEYQGATHFKLK